MIVHLDLLVLLQLANKTINGANQLRFIKKIPTIQWGQSVNEYHDRLHLAWSASFDI